MLDELWSLAVDAELLVTTPGQAHPGPALDALIDDRDQDVVQVWADLLHVVLDELRWSPGAEDLIVALTRLYVEGGSVPTGELATAVHGLATLDAVEVRDGGLRLSPLRVFGLGGWFETIGIGAPLVQDLAQTSAGQLLELGGGIDDPARFDVIFEDPAGRAVDVRRHRLGGA